MDFPSCRCGVVNTGLGVVPMSDSRWKRISAGVIGTATALPVLGSVVSWPLGSALQKTDLVYLPEDGSGRVYQEAVRVGEEPVAAGRRVPQLKARDVSKDEAAVRSLDAEAP